MTFLLVWGKDSYSGKFLVLFPCIYALQPTLVHFYQTSSLLPSPLTIIALASLRLQYSLPYSEHINHIQAFSFLSSLYLFHAQAPISVAHVQSYCCICFGSIIHIWGRTCVLQFHLFTCEWQNSFFFVA
jgi:hypothetical protein